MKNINEICILIQARLSSERVPGKMLKPFAGTTLMDILLEKLSRSKIINKKNIYLSAYEDKLKNLGKKYNINIFHRSKKSSMSEGEPLSEMFEWHDKLPYKYVVKLNACNPFLKISTIDNFIQDFIKSENEGSFTVFKKKNYFWDEKFKPITDWKNLKIMNTKLINYTYEAAHCLDASRLNIIKDGHWIDSQIPINPNFFVIDEFEAYDIDYSWQFELYEKIYRILNLK